MDLTSQRGGRASANGDILLDPDQITGRERSGDAPQCGVGNRMSRLRFRRGIF
jgi:hypothetical protein